MCRAVAVPTLVSFSKRQRDAPIVATPVTTQLYVSPLSLAVHRKQYEVCRLLVRHGVDPTISEDFGESPYGLALTQVCVCERWRRASPEPQRAVSSYRVV